MTLETITRTLVALEIVVLLIWLFQIWFPGKGADPAGKGLGAVYTLGLTVYVVIGLGFLLIYTPWSMVIAAVMAVLPIGVTIYGLIRWIKNR
jgi:hypothetical protein